MAGRDYGPTGCCQPFALAFIGVFAVIGWGAVFTAVQIVRWIV